MKTLSDPHNPYVLPYNSLEMPKKILVLICALLSYILSFGQSIRYQIKLEPPVATGNKYTCKSIETIIEFYSSTVEWNAKPVEFRLNMHSYNNSIGTATIYLAFRPVMVIHRMKLHYDVPYNVVYGNSETVEVTKTTFIEPGSTTYTIKGFDPFQGDGEAYAYEADIKMTVTEFAISSPEKDEDYMCARNLIDVSFSFPIQETQDLYITPEGGKRQLLKTIDRYSSITSLSCSKIVELVGYYKGYTLELNSSSLKMPPIYPNYPLKEGDEVLYVKDNHLHASLEIGDKLSIESYFYPSQFGYYEQGKTTTSIDESFDLIGPYTLKFERDGYCQVSREVFVPIVDYNTINSSTDVFFWSEKEEREAVSLQFNYPTDSNIDNMNFEFETSNKLGKDKIPSTGSHIDENNPKISVHNPTDFNKKEEKDNNYTPYSFITDKSLEWIKVRIAKNSEKLIPVHITLPELKFYPNIDATLNDITPPVCNGSDVSVKISDIKDGLGGDYTFVVGDDYNLDHKKEGDGIWSVSINKNQIESGSSLETISLSIFDANGPIDDTGLGHRSKSFSFTVKRPQKLEITEVSSTNLRCFQDKSGSIEITKVNRSYEDEPVLYHWYISPNINQEIKEIDSNPKIEGLSKNDYVVKITNNECEFTSDIISIDEPPLLQFTQVSPIHAQCFNYSNGSIFTSVDGGTPYEDGGYRYAWSVGAITNNLLNIPAGKYHLTVTDAHDCDVSTEIEITQPDELINSLTPSYTICQGSELLIDDGKENMKVFGSYEWHLPDSTIQQGRLLTVSTDMLQGKYVLKSKNEDCFTLDTTMITFADNNLPIRFLVPTESFFDDTLVIAEDSEIDDNYTWRYAFNTEMFSDITDKVVNPNANLTFLHIDRSGNDTITMYADNGFCKASLSKEVTVSPHFRPEDYDYTVDAAGIFSRLQIGPNPNNGEFTLFANLTEDSPLTIALNDVSHSRKIPIDFSKYKTPASHYQIPFQGLGLHSGAYTLLVSANGETKQIKFVVE